MTLGPAGLVLHGAGAPEQQPLLCGAMHYYQHPREQWGRCLDALAGIGLRIVDSYVPWAVHEREPGQLVFDADAFAGERLAAGEPGPGCRNLVAFLDACHERGLRVLLRPGPGVNAELTGFGYPARILADERCQARGAAGNPVILPFPPRCFPVPSLASAAFLAEAQRWLRAVAAVIAPRLWPDGPVVAVQVDNELTLFFRDGAYDQDYHPDAVAQYRAFLAARYGDALPAAYAVPAAQAEPPRRFEAGDAAALVPHLDWVAFKDALILGTLGRFAATLRDAGVRGVPLTHNYPAVGTGSAHSVAAAEQVVDLVGLDLYQRRRSYRAARRAALQLAGQSRLPFVAELGWGGWPWWFPQALPDQLATALTALMHGARGLGFYMAVERDRWFGAPISATGEPREPRYETTRRLVAAIGETGLPALRREVAVALMRVAEYEHLARCTSLADPLPSLLCGVFDIGAAELCSDESYGLAGPVQLEQAVFSRAVEQVLDDLEVPYHLVDSAADAASLARYRVLIVPAFDFVDPALLARLAAYVAAGGALALGPRVPTLDRAMRELAQQVPPHRLLPFDELGRLLEELLAAQGIEPGPRADREHVHLARYDDAAGEPVLLFAANAGPTSCTTAVSGVPQEGRWFWDALSGDPVDPCCLNVDARQVRMIRSRRRPPSAPPAPEEGAR